MWELEIVIDFFNSFIFLNNTFNSLKKKINVDVEKCES